VVTDALNYFLISIRQERKRSDDSLAAQMDCWASVPNKVLNLINKELTKLLAFVEIKATMAAMPKK
jgi:hypothetical protein